MFEISSVMHPYFKDCYQDWTKWRDVYESGDDFIDLYLRKFSRREKAGDFRDRKAVTYVPAFAKSAINEIKNSIFSRMADVTRKGGSETYESAVKGDKGGVDLLGSSMTSFFGRFVIPDLLTISRIGIFVDSPELAGVTLSENRNKRPYIYVYHAEDIRSWAYDESSKDNEFCSILLRDYVDVTDDETGLPIDRQEQYRWMWIADDGKVHVRLYSGNNFADQREIVLDIDRIPFVVANISDSLLSDVANYQISLLNLASADINYALHSNYPFYVEQYDERTESSFLRTAGVDQGGEKQDAEAGKVDSAAIGTAQGRKYPRGLERPAFIHPSSEPLMASIAKEEQMKKEIRLLVHLAVTSLTPTKMASAESKDYDERGLEAGLSYIGLELERAERLIASYWAMYEKSRPATVNYPEAYDLKTEEDVQAEIDHLTKLMSKVPSKTFQKELAKRIAALSLGRRASSQVIEDVIQEIDAAKAFTIDPEIIAKDVEIGIVDLETASEIRGYPKGSVEKAADDHANRLARISEAQSKNEINGAARGNPDQDGDTGSGKKEKQKAKDTTKDPVVKDKQRGAAANVNE